eukprot:GFUD01001188.1.p1 GENE.GFUD01001188.1~~GFUD01001188.1.p1  ORF type:complete len:1412 (+),score=425.44 GFUD01001188.1:75-4310(+)
MAEATQPETVASAAMEETSAEPTSEEDEEEEDRFVELTASVDDAEQFTCDEEDCQDVFESDEALEKHIRDIHFEGFEIVDYKDPLTEDTEVHFKRNYDRKISQISLVGFVSRSDSSSSGISGLMNRLDEPETESDDVEEIAMEDAEAMEDPEESKNIVSTISDELAEKIQFSIKNSVIGIVKAINEDTVEEYCDFIDKNYPVDVADWPALKEDIIAASKKGPKIFVKCSRGKITGYKKLDNINIVAFIKQQNETEPKQKVIEGGVKEFTDSDVDFALDDFLKIPAFDDCVIRIEVRKLRTKDMNGRVLVGYTEIPLRDIPSTTIESYYELQKGGLEGLRKISMPSTDAAGHLVLTLSRDESEDDPNITVSNILKEYFLGKAKTFFSINISSEIVYRGQVSFQISVNQNSSSYQQKQGQAFYQKLLTKDGNYPKNENNSAKYNIDCIMSNSLELGVEVRKRSVSPGTNTLSAPNSHKRSSSLSPSQSMITLMSSNRRESTGSNSSLLSINSEYTPKKKKSSNMLDKLNKTIGSYVGSIGEDIYDIVSPTAKPIMKTVPIDKIVSTLYQHKFSNQTIEDKEDISWDTKLEVLSDVKLNSDELNRIYENAIIESIKASENDNWDGTFSKSLSSLMNMINCFVDAKRKDVNLSIAEAFLKAHSISSFSDFLLKKHIETIVKSGTSSENLKTYVETCLKIIESHRSEQNILSTAIMENLKVISTQNTKVTSDIKKHVEISITKIFNSWERDLTKKVKEKSPTSTHNPIEVCRDILNLHIFHETQLGDKVHQEMFQDILDYKTVTGDKYLDLCQEMIKNNLSQNEKKIVLKYVENSPRVKALILVYETFCAFKRIFKNLIPMQKLPQWLFDLYEQFPDLWMDLAIYKAEAQVENLLKHLRENEERFQKEESESSQNNGNLTRQNSVDDITNETLVSFLGIADTCWTFRRELNWPSLDVNLRTGLKLIEDFAKFETRILNLFESIHMKDEEYDVVELSRTIKLLDGLLKRHHTTVEEVSSLHSQIADDDDMNEVDREYFSKKMTTCYEAIQRVKDKAREEILSKMKFYCEGRRPRIKKHIVNKHLVNEEECLMTCIDGELQLMYKYIQRKYHSDVMAALWKVMEEELKLQFEDRKQRNLSKNKPSRFEHYKEALPVIMDVKKGMHDGKVISDLSLDTLSEMYKEVIILTEDSKILMTKVLRLKSQAQKIDFDENGNNPQMKNTSMAVKLAYVTGTDKILVEVTNVHNITPREKKTSSTIQLYVRFSPDRMGTGQVVEHSTVFKDVIRSIIFELEEEPAPVRFEFNIDHLSSNKEFEDGFLIVDLFHVNKAGLKLFIGECVSQVKMNGMLVTELVQISSESEFPSPDIVPGLNYQLHHFQEVYQSEVYLELHRRTDEAAKGLMAKDDKLRKKSFFTKFS